jgi:hypothetical protein
MDDSSDIEPNSPADRRDVIIRDDRTDFRSLLDIVKDRAAAGGRVTLVDTGKFGLPELEWLGEVGTDMATSDLALRESGDFILMAKAAKKSGRHVAYLHNGPFDGGDQPKAVSFFALVEMARFGIHIYVSDGRVARDSDALEKLAFACRKGGARFVFYRHAALALELENLLRQGAWVHLPAAVLRTEADVLFLADGVRAAREAGGGVLLHVEQAPDGTGLEDLFEAGAYLLFRTPPRDYRDPLRMLERRAKRRIPDPTTYYLHSEFML